MAAGDLTTLDAVKAFLDIATPGSDTALQQIITDISTEVPNALCRGILTDTYTEVRQGNGKDRFQLKNTPVRSITSVEWAGSKITTSVDLFDNAQGAATDGESLILVGYTMPYRQPVRITYVAGWDQPPADIAGAVIELVAEQYARRAHTGETSHSSNGATTVSFSQKDMHDAIRAKLFNYERVAPLC